MRETNRNVGQLLKNAPEQLRQCFKLAELEQEWSGIVGEEIARRSMLAGCRVEDGCAVITLHAADAGTVTSMNFLKSSLAQMFKNYLDFSSVRIEIKTGKINRISAARPPLPEWRRRAPVIVSEQAVEHELEFTSTALEDKELALIFAKIKALVERRKNRRT